MALPERRVCVVGSLNMDLVVRAPRFPMSGETIMGGEFATFAGGKGANQAVARIAEHRLHRDQVLVAVVDDQDVDGFPHRDSHTRNSEIS